MAITNIHHRSRSAVLATTATAPPGWARSVGVAGRHSGEYVSTATTPRSGPPPGPPLGSRIIKAANAFDDLVGSSLDPGRAAAAVQRLRLDTASEYDPATVEALSRVVNRRSLLL